MFGLGDLAKGVSSRGPGDSFIALSKVYSGISD